MHAIFHFHLLILLVSSSIFHLPCTRIDARKLDSSVVFSVDLIHRDSVNSPYHNSSRRSPLGSVSRHHKISRSSNRIYGNKDVQTEIIPGSGDYLIKLAIGTPPVEFTALADTGSDLLWLQCAPCTLCFPQDPPSFDPTKSYTFDTVPCDAQSCNQLGVERDRDCKTGSCAYQIVYGDETITVGGLNSDTVSFGSPETAFPSFVFGCGHEQVGQFDNTGGGVVGLGAGPLSLVTQLGPYINYKFSYCLTPSDSGVNSKMNFGVETTRPGVVSTPFSNQGTAGALIFHKVTLDGITVGGSSVPVSSDVIIDSGTTLTLLPSDVYKSVKAAVKGAITASTVNDPAGKFDPCYDTSSLGQGFSPPDVVFHFREADVVLKAENTFRNQGGLTCMAMLAADGTPILGNIAQVNFEVGYDLLAKRVSFAPVDCTKY